mmetsp:Transcript_58446/g.139024  ORF Transcript_58446/g.139024 Transcript_58446/m.139024 type:complete len:2621 (+) Transcript_58446:41-7903(+)
MPPPLKRDSGPPKFPELKEMLLRVLVLQGKDVQSATDLHSLEQLGDFMQQEMLLMSGTVLNWDKTPRRGLARPDRAVYVENLSKIHESLLKLKRPVPRSSQEIGGSAATFRAEELGQRLRSVLEKWGTPCGAADFSTVPGVASWLLDQGFLLRLPEDWSQCSRKRDSQHAEQRKKYCRNHASVLGAVVDLEGRLEGRRIAEREEAEGLLEHAGVLCGRGPKELMTDFEARLVNAAADYLEGTGVILGRPERISDVLTTLRAYVRDHHFHVATEGVIAELKCLSSGAEDVLRGVRYRLTDSQRVEVQRARQIRQQTVCEKWDGYEQRSSMVRCAVCAMDTFHPGFPLEMRKVHHAYHFAVKREEGPRWSAAESPTYAAGDLVCPLCSKDEEPEEGKRAKGLWKKWSARNGVPLGREEDFPEVFRGATDFEAALVGLCSPCMRVVRIGGGNLKVVGNSIVMEQDFDSFDRSLPKFPSKCAIMLVSKGIEDEKKHPTIFGVDQQKVRDLIDYLRRENVKYDGISVNEEALSCLQDCNYFSEALRKEEDTMGGGVVKMCVQTGASEQVASLRENVGLEEEGSDLRFLVEEMEEDLERMGDLGPGDNVGLEAERGDFRLLVEGMEEQLDRMGDLGPGGCSGTDEAFLHCVGEVSSGELDVSEEQATAQVFEDLVGREAAGIFKVLLSRSVPENEPGLFAKTYPNIFLKGKGDFTDTTVDEVGRVAAFEFVKDFGTWSRRLTWASDRTFVQHPVAKFHLMNVYDRQCLRQCAAYYSRTKLSDSFRTAEQLFEVAKEGHMDGFFHQVHALTGKVKGTDAYFAERRRDLDAMVLHFGMKSKPIWPMAFVTFTLAENHHDTLWRILAKREGFDPDNESERVRKCVKLARDNPHVVNEFFYSRFHGFMETVLKPAWGVSEFAARFEFAQKRGAVHVHMMIWREDGMPHGVLRRQGLAGLERFCKELSLSCVHPGEPTEWPVPEGPMPDTFDPGFLRSRGIGAWNDHRLNVDAVNSLGLHKCSRFCVKPGRLHCRAGFGSVLGAQTSDTGEPGFLGGKVLHESFELRVRQDGRLEAEGPRNHPRTLNVPRDLLRAWKANLDVSLLLAPGDTLDPRFVDSIYAATAYMAGYQCKTAKTAQAAVDMYLALLKELVDKNPEMFASSSIKRMLFKCMACRHIPQQEAVWRACELPYFDTSVKNIRVSLGTTRLVKKSKKSSGAAEGDEEVDCDASSGESNNCSDVYAKLVALPADNAAGVRARAMSLREFLCRGGKAKTMDKEPTFVPVFSGVGPIRPTTISAAPRLACVILRIAKPAYVWPGAVWSHQEGGPGQQEVDDLVQWAGSDPNCPPLFKVWARWCEAPYDVRSGLHYSSSDLEGGPGAERQAPGFEYLNFPQTDPNDDDDFCSDAYRDPEAFDTGRLFPPSRFSRNAVQGAETWLAGVVEEVARQARKLPIFSAADWTDLEDSPNEEQALMLSLVLDCIVRFEDARRGARESSKEGADEFFLFPDASCVRAILCGGAGTGKTWLLRVLVEVVQVLTGRSDSACVCAPTGAAASIVNGETLHSVFQIPVVDDGHFVDDFEEHLSGESLRTLEAKCENLVLVVIDERSMVSPELLGYVDLRLRQGRRHCGQGFGDAPFGGVPCVLIAGDDGQLAPVLALSLHAAMNLIHAKEAGGDALNNRGRAERIRTGVFRFTTDFREAVYLKRSVRQQVRPCWGCRDHEPGQECGAFPELLHRLRFGKLEDKDYQLLVDRELSKLSEWDSEQSSNFQKDGTLRIVPTNVQVHEVTVTALADRQDRLIENDPDNAWGAVLQSRTGTTFPQLTGRKSDVDGGIPARTWYVKDHPAVLTINILPRCGLFNGTFSTMEDAVFAEGGRPDEHGVVLPKYVVLRCPGHQLPRVWNESDPDLIPVPVFKAAGRSSRLGFPFRAASAVTPFKAQGMTIGDDKVWKRVEADLGPERTEGWAGGSGIVIVTRTEQLHQLAFSGKLSLQRIKAMFMNSHMAGVRVEDARLKLMHAASVEKIRAWNVVVGRVRAVVEARPANHLGPEECTESFLSRERAARARRESGSALVGASVPRPASVPLSGGIGEGGVGAVAVVKSRSDFVWQAAGSGEIAEAAFKRLVMDVKRQFEDEADEASGRYVFGLAPRSAFTIRTVPCDGTCMFHSFCVCIGGVWARQGFLLRRLTHRLYQALAHHRTLVRSSGEAFTGWVGRREAESFDDHLDRLCSYTREVGSTEQLVLAKVFQCEVLCFDEAASPPDSFKCSDHFGEHNTPTIRMTYFGAHFNALILAQNGPECVWELSPLVQVGVADNLQVDGVLREEAPLIVGPHLPYVAPDADMVEVLLEPALEHTGASYDIDSMDECYSEERCVDSMDECCPEERCVGSSDDECTELAVTSQLDSGRVHLGRGDSPRLPREASPAGVTFKRNVNRKLQMGASPAGGGGVSRSFESIRSLSITGNVEELAARETLLGRLKTMDAEAEKNWERPELRPESPVDEDEMLMSAPVLGKRRRPVVAVEYPSIVVVDKYDCVITIAILDCLSPLGELTSEIITFMLCWWAERTGATFHDRRSKSSPGGTSGVHILNTWFYETLSGTIDGRVTKQYSFEEVKKWTKKWTREVRPALPLS